MERPRRPGAGQKPGPRMVVVELVSHPLARPFELLHAVQSQLLCEPRYAQVRNRFRCNDFEYTVFYVQDSRVEGAAAKVDDQNHHW